MRLYFAGMEQCMNSYDYVPLKMDNIFTTFFYANNTSRALVELKRQGHKGIKTVDSGAHSFFGFTGTSTMSHHNKKDKEEMPDPNEYMARYIIWLKKHFDLFDYFVELDIQSIVGIEKVKYWRRRLQREGLWEKCIPCLHSVDTPATWEETIKGAASRYVGFEGLRKKQVTLPYKELLKTCYDLGVRVHGFALTNYDILEEYPFWSADSTTWTSCVRYGTFIARDEYGRMKQKIPTKGNYLLHGHSLKLHNSQRSKEISLEKLKHSAQKLRESETFLHRLWINRGVDWDKRMGGHLSTPASCG